MKLVKILLLSSGVSVIIGCEGVNGPVDSVSMSSVEKSSSNNSVGLDVNDFSGATMKLSLVNCELSNGISTECMKIVSQGIPVEHKVGPFCPAHITDSADKGGKWFVDDNMVDVDGKFIKDLAITYLDPKWQMYDANGNVKRLTTQAECEMIAGARISDATVNHCIQCEIEHLGDDFYRTHLIPVTPSPLESPRLFGASGPGENGAEGGRPPPPQGGQRGMRPDRPPPPPGGGRESSGAPSADGLSRGPRGGQGGPQVRGLALNGVPFDAPAPLHLILSGYSIAPLDDAGGHINPDTGYHYHSITGKTKEILQSDGHEPLIGYALDGYGLYAHSHDADLDECRGHSDNMRGYHYHVAEAGSNNIISCFRGATALTQQ